MPKKKRIFSRECLHCGGRFKTASERKKYDHPNCRKYAFDQRQKDKLRRATEILKLQASL